MQSRRPITKKGATDITRQQNTRNKHQGDSSSLAIINFHSSQSTRLIFGTDCIEFGRVSATHSCTSASKELNAKPTAALPSLAVPSPSEQLRQKNKNQSIVDSMEHLLLSPPEQEVPRMRSLANQDDGNLLVNGTVVILIVVGIVFFVVWYVLLLLQQVLASRKRCSL